MNSQIELDSIIEVINRAEKIGIFTHVSPDGDAIGSSLALYLGLKQLKKDVDVIADEYSRCFNFLPYREEIKAKGAKEYDLAIALDCASKGRLFDPKNSFDNSAVTVSIDHHSSNTYFADYNYVEENSPAASKTLIKILKRLNISINKEVGTCLMSGIITDSGGFRYNTVDDETFEFAAQMLDVGVNISDIYYRTFDVKTKAQFELSSIANARLKFYSNDRIALTYVTSQDLKKVKAMAGDHEGIVNTGRNIEGVEISIFLREDVDGTYKVSLRSNDNVNVSEVAEAFGGGGHDRAAGCVIDLPLDKAIKKLIKEATRRL
ncbi:MAG: bifunctional oligoribonuclease/PAP phosphatase NrnA [Bacilli bacterium]|nr:bifunctional oligoribonuclease/PAP phosphatase NrnA [Bacilli bacterium]